ncbi:hypothetical protein SKAU_G00163960 [Synaphobranchus kaupii]|uniref:Transmembrane protein 254 n=1 Tax=Synaphobranchus kaupii TaxID=118154 RepID=A0A9Q1FJ91_SYNKA|nr:hypothetical protein SKAU_G00163960 [Synaphobranchus kaupii]
MARTDACAYFKNPSLFWIATIGLSMGYYTCTVFWPEQMPFEMLGPLGSLSKYLLQNHYPLLYTGWWMAWLVHMAEALYSLKVCSDKGVDSLTARGLWFLQTFLFGFASLILLLKYRPDPRPKRH